MHNEMYLLSVKSTKKHSLIIFSVLLKIILDLG